MRLREFLGVPAITGLVVVAYLGMALVRIIFGADRVR
jgi:hypothetical protein